ERGDDEMILVPLAHLSHVRDAEALDAPALVVARAEHERTGGVDHRSRRRYVTAPHFRRRSRGDFSGDLAPHVRDLAHDRSPGSLSLPDLLSTSREATARRRYRICRAAGAPGMHGAGPAASLGSESIGVR